MSNGASAVLSEIVSAIEILKDQGAPSDDILSLLLEEFPNYPDGDFWNELLRDVRS
jgi:hypothetical protein